MKNINEINYQLSPVYSVEISRDPETNFRRLVEATELSINKWSVFLQCEIHFLNENGSKKNIKPSLSQKRLSADNAVAGPWIDPVTKERVYPSIIQREYDEEDPEDVTLYQHQVSQGEVFIPDDSILRYTYLLSLFNGGNPVDVKNLVAYFVNAADENEEFNSIN